MTIKHTFPRVYSLSGRYSKRALPILPPLLRFRLLLVRLILSRLLPSRLILSRLLLSRLLLLLSRLESDNRLPNAKNDAFRQLSTLTR